MAINQKTYSDLDLTFRKQPVTRDVSFSYNEQSVIRSIRNLLSTEYFERPFKPDLGSSINHLLFEPVSVLTANLISDEIKRVIYNFEPRAKISEVDVIPNPDQNAFTVNLYFFVENQTTPTAINLILKRTR